MSEKKLVSIIIPYFNLGEYLKEAVDSVLDQTYGEWELIIVNDGSTDPHSLEVLEQYRSTSNKRIKVLEKENEGLPATRNFGIKGSKGEYICCLDADDKYKPEFLEKSTSALELDKQKKLGFVTTYVELFGAEKGLWKLPEPSIENLLLENTVHVASLFRRSAWEDAGGYNTKLKEGYQDWDFWISIASRGYMWKVINEPLFCYRRRVDSMLSKSSKKDHKLFSAIIRKHSGFFHDNFENLLLFNKKKFNELSKVNKELNKELLQYTRKLSVIGLQIDQLAEIKNQLDIVNMSIVWKLRGVIKNKEWGMFKKFKEICKLIIERLAIFRATKNFLIKILWHPETIKNQKHNGPLISVVIPMYNYGRYLSELVQSLNAQGLSDGLMEVILVEGYSDDGTRELVKRTELPPFFKVFYQNQRSSIGENRLKGIEMAKGRYICLLDADDLVAPGYFKNAIQTMEKKHSDVLYTDMRYFGEEDTTVKSPEKFKIEDLFYFNPIPSASIFRKSFWSENKIGYSLSREVFEDWDFWIRMAKKGARFTHLKGYYHMYRVHTSEGLSMTDQRLSEQKQKENKTLEPHKDFIGTNEYKFAVKRQNKKFKVINPDINVDW